MSYRTEELPNTHFYCTYKELPTLLTSQKVHLFVLTLLPFFNLQAGAAFWNLLFPFF